MHRERELIRPEVPVALPVQCYGCAGGGEAGVQRSKLARASGGWQGRPGPGRAGSNRLVIPDAALVRC